MTEESFFSFSRSDLPEPISLLLKLGPTANRANVLTAKLENRIIVIKQIQSGNKRLKEIFCDHFVREHIVLLGGAKGFRSTWRRKMTSRLVRAKFKIQNFGAFLDDA